MFIPSTAAMSNKNWQRNCSIQSNPGTTRQGSLVMSGTSCQKQHKAELKHLQATEDII